MVRSTGREQLGSQLRIVSLFSGIGALDLGLERAGHRVVEMCEIWPAARRVLTHRFPSTPVALDVQSFLPSQLYDGLVAGFPCTDISHAGGKTGISGRNSGLVEHVFRIARATRPRFVVLENVPNLLALHRGAGMALITNQLEDLGYYWAYRTVDSRFTGVPHRRPRVILVADCQNSPAGRLLTESSALINEGATVDGVHGFYWTEGRTGLGLVAGAIPTLKGGSTLGLPSAPAIWAPRNPRGRRFVLPDIEDGEALQGLPRGWTANAVVDGETDLRWKLVGNAVTVGVGRWIGDLLAETSNSSAPVQALPTSGPLVRTRRWPAAGWGDASQAWESGASAWPREEAGQRLGDVVDLSNARALSHRATKGFVARLDEKRRNVPADFYRDLEDHLTVSRPALKKPSVSSWASSETSRRRMQTQRQRNTKPEVELRRILHGRGLRYRLQVRPLPQQRSRVDIAFPREKVAVDVRGCFWHRCPDHGTAPSANADRWAEKLARNVERDEATVRALTEAGWQVEVVWEHEDPRVAADRVELAVRSRRLATASAGDPKHPLTES